jgi:hypothetical protein
MVAAKSLESRFTCGLMTALSLWLIFNRSVWRTSVEERDFFDERQETRKAMMTCPHCQQAAEYELGWFVRTKKKQLPGRADERDRAKFAKARSYMVRRDDLVACKNLRCRKRFEVTSVQSVAFLE